MPSLKDYRDRIASVKSTKKITSAMKMVAAAKLKKAQDKAEASQPYARAMAAMMGRVAGGITITETSPKLLVGTGSDQRHLLVVVTSDRGLAGGFNANLVRRTKIEMQRLRNEGKEVKLLCVGRKGRDVLKREFSSLIVQGFTGIGARGVVAFNEADEVAQYVLGTFAAGEFDVCTMIYNEFKSVLAQPPRAQQIIPLEIDDALAAEDSAAQGVVSPYAFEPDEEEILKELLPKNVAVQLYRALLDSAAGEQAARMTAMDNATRNAGDRINALTLQYNRARQAYITKELIEIISGAEAL